MIVVGVKTQGRLLSENRNFPKERKLTLSYLEITVV
jgi:hypothetical protein